MHFFLALVILWAAVYAVAVTQWREVALLVVLFVANLFLAGSRKP